MMCFQCFWFFKLKCLAISWWWAFNTFDWSSQNVFASGLFIISLMFLLFNQCSGYMCADQCLIKVCWLFDQYINYMYMLLMIDCFTDVLSSCLIVDCPLIVFHQRLIVFYTAKSCHEGVWSNVTFFWWFSNFLWMLNSCVILVLLNLEVDMILHARLFCEFINRIS